MGRSDSKGNPSTFANSLDQDLHSYLMASLSQNSKRTYSSGEKHFINFCGHLKLNPSQALPANESTLIYFAVYLAKTLKVGTIKTYLAGVRNLHVLNGFDLPLKQFVRLQYVLRGIKRVQGVSKRVRLPITIHHLTMFDLLMPRAHQDNIMVWAAFTLAFFGFLRISEFTCSNHFNPNLHLTTSDIRFFPSFTSPHYMTVEIKASKTDPFRKGMTLVIGKTSQVTCPVNAMKKYLDTIPKSCKGPLFVYANGKRLTRQHLTRELRYLLSRLGLNSSNYAGHSFRIGAATSAAVSGLPSWLINTLGKWTSDYFETYISMPISVFCQATQKLGSTCT